MENAFKGVLGIYKNGNYLVTILKDGTKIRQTEADEFIPDHPETFDCKITDCCDGNCIFCYEGCTPKGLHGSLMKDGKPCWKFIENIHPYTEIALNGNDLTHPDLEDFLRYLKSKKAISNMTVNQKHFMRHYDTLKRWSDEGLIYGLGISLVDSSNQDFLTKAEHFPNSVIHVINGIVTSDDWDNMDGRKLKFLILGYKNLQRGIQYFVDNSENIIANQEDLQYNLRSIVKTFPVVSFDNLAIKQLDVKKILFRNNDEEWNEFFMGDDGNYSLYVDLVKGTFSKNSCMPVDERFPIGDMTLTDMLAFLKNKYNK